MKYLFTLFFLPAMLLPVEAQKCGIYDTTLIIYDESMRAVDNASVQLSPQGKDETRGMTFEKIPEQPNVFYVGFYEGHQLKEKYTAYIAAPTFQTAFAQKNRTPRCDTG